MLGSVKPEVDTRTLTRTEGVVSRFVRRRADNRRVVFANQSHGEEPDGLEAKARRESGETRRPDRRGVHDGPAERLCQEGNMSGTIINLIIQLIAGAIGGNVVGSAAKNVNLGTAGNTVAGAVGGSRARSLLTSLIPMLQNAAGGAGVGA